MEVWASIDIMDGKVVRLVRGDPSNVIVYNSNPHRVLQSFESMRFDGVHVVDLDAALEVRGDNLELIRDLVRGVERVQVQVGGGLRDRERISRLLRVDVDRVVLGTIIFTDPGSVSSLIRDFGPERFVAALDYRGRNIVYKGWRDKTDISLREGYELVLNMGLRNVLTTNTDRDGTLSGPDVLCFSSLPPEYKSITYVSGGITTPKHVIELRRLGVKGTIIGRALYEGIYLPSEFIEAGKRDAAV